MEFYRILVHQRVFIYWASFKRPGSALCLPHTHTHKLLFPLQNLLRQDKCGTCNCARALISPCRLITAVWKPCAHYARLCCFLLQGSADYFFQENSESLMLSLVELPLWCANKPINKWMIKKKNQNKRNIFAEFQEFVPCQTAWWTCDSAADKDNFQAAFWKEQMLGERLTVLMAGTISTAVVRWSIKKNKKKHR